MRLYEYEGSSLFAEEGIPVPASRIAGNSTEARRAAEELGLPVVVKAQVLAGGRGLGGGVRPADTLAQVEEATAGILASTIAGQDVSRVLVAEKVAVALELYLSVTIDGYEGVPCVILSTEGGVSIEELARTRPEALVSAPVSISNGLRLFEVRQLARKAGLTGNDLVRVAGILKSLYEVFIKYDALVAEINPLVRTPDGVYIAVDSKIEIDDSSLYRQAALGVDPVERLSNPLERRGREAGIAYVDLDGDVAIISSGAGLGMATMDVIGTRFRPANFLETGGAITADLLYEAMDLVFQKRGLRGVFINLDGGINPIHEGARGIVRYIKERGVSVPVVAKALGNRQQETWETLRNGGVAVVTDADTEKGVEELFRLIGERGE